MRVRDLLAIPVALVLVGVMVLVYGAWCVGLSVAAFWDWVVED